MACAQSWHAHPDWVPSQDETRTRRSTNRQHKPSSGASGLCTCDAHLSYYDMPEGAHIIHLYADGTWDSDKAGAEQSLEAYLTWIREKRSALRAALGERS